MIAPACNWTVDQAGRTICATRRDLHRAVVEITKMPAKTKQQADVRDHAFKTANEALEAHHCTPKPEMQARPVGGGAVHAVADVAPAGPVSSKCICDGAVGFSKVDGALARLCPVHGQPPRTPSDSDGPPTLLALHRLLLECNGAALVYGMRLERAAHPDAPADIEARIASAEKRMTDANEALMRALEAYRPALRRMPISAYLPEGEWPQG